MVDITHYLELGDPSHSSCLAEAALLPAPRIESYRGIQPISLDLGVAAAAAFQGVVKLRIFGGHSSRRISRFTIY